MARVKVKYSKGMLPTESLIIIKTMSGPIELFVDNVHLVEDELRVEVLDMDESQALIRLPAEPMWGGKNIVVALPELVK